MTDIRDDDVDSDGDDGESVAPEAPKAKGDNNWIRPLLRWAGAVVFVAVLAVAGFEGWMLLRQHQRDVAASQALNAARDFAVTLTSADAATVDQDFANILDGATGDFKDKYTGASAQLRKVLIDNKVTTRGEVVASAVKSATGNKVEVLLFVKQSVTNSTAPQPRTDFTAVTITMEQVDGRWLASTVELPGGAG
ncbi:hypothetical protein [Mycobacterium spongiae]|uniref:Mce protein n=1 Tax=Mycobacterium spongiae TaxID=886343 RepID=A0A975JXX9_9MYCO|nr:hypothetical protein [Mycobacterium spongiae]QUR67742.1 hypothetical protein F6B93_12090 [Mycobacterium spongiae]